MAAVASASVPVAHLIAEMEAQHLRQPQAMPPLSSPAPSSQPFQPFQPSQAPLQLPGARRSGIHQPLDTQLQANARMAQRASFRLRQQFAAELDGPGVQGASTSPAR